MRDTTRGSAANGEGRLGRSTPRPAQSGSDCGARTCKGRADAVRVPYSRAAADVAGFYNHTIIPQRAKSAVGWVGLYTGREHAQD